MRNLQAVLSTLLTKKTAVYHEECIVFDRYQENSLKGGTRATRTKGYSAVHSKSLMQQKLITSKQKIFVFNRNQKRINSVPYFEIKSTFCEKLCGGIS